MANPDWTDPIDYEDMDICPACTGAGDDGNGHTCYACKGSGGVPKNPVHEKDPT